MANQVATIQSKGLVTFHDYMKTKAKAINAVMPKHMSHERVASIAIAACQKNPLLMQCKQETVWSCVRDAAVLGLEVGMLGAAYLVPFRNAKAGGYDCQLIIGYQGLIDLCRRSGHIESIEAHIIHENDQYDIVYGTESKIEHKPELFKDPGKMFAVYAVAKLKGGQIQTEVMTKAEVDAIRNRSKSKTGPWQTDYNEMARKTAVRRLVKYLPKSIEMQDAINREEATENGDPAFMAATFDEAQLKEADATITDEGTDELKKAATKPTKPKAASKPAKKNEAPTPEKNAEAKEEASDCPAWTKLSMMIDENPDSVQNAIAEAAEQYDSCKGLKVIADIDTTNQGQVSTIMALVV